jgi:hypothetical protein
MALDQRMLQGKRIQFGINRLLKYYCQEESNVPIESYQGDQIGRILAQWTIVLFLFWILVSL